MVEVYTWEPTANSGKPLFCLEEKQVPFTHHYIDIGRTSSFAAHHGTEPGRWG
jgi:glutathione S-transferase/GST-like protein